ncbi:putative lipoprotein [Burkholderia pseudomallei TSV5]|nr:putative lipoprotein [Burkholderia pseudomallei TSV5]
MAIRPEHTTRRRASRAVAACAALAALAGCMSGHPPYGMPDASTIGYDARTGLARAPDCAALEQRSQMIDAGRRELRLRDLRQPRGDARAARRSRRAAAVRGRGRGARRERGAPLRRRPRDAAEPDVDDDVRHALAEAKWAHSTGWAARGP